MEFQEFKKIPRLSRDMVITEKIDGTNGQIVILTNESIQLHFDNPISFDEFYKKYGLFTFKDVDKEYYLFAGSKSRWLDTSSKGDNYGFAKWVQANAEELLKLGEGHHYGEWMGQGIQRNYGLKEKRFYLFNLKKWEDNEVRPKCCYVVPRLYTGTFDTQMTEKQLNILAENGSVAITGYMNPEGIVIWHSSSGQLFKKTIKDDEKPKGQN